MDGLLRNEDEICSKAAGKRLATVERIEQVIEKIAAAPATKDDASGLLGEGAYVVEKYLNTRAASIYSGSSEIHPNLIAGHIINLHGNR